MVDFKNIDSKGLVDELNKNVHDNKAGPKEISEFLSHAKKENPALFNEELKANLREILGEIEELQETLRDGNFNDKEQSKSSGDGSEISSGIGFGIFGKLDIFSKFVRILKEGGPYSIIALLFLSNVWLALELQKANDRIIDLLVTLKVSGQQVVVSDIDATSIKNPRQPSTPPAPDSSPLPILDNLKLPPGVRERVLQIQSSYRDEMLE